MEAFAHLSILISIILGLGIAELLSGFARTLEKRRVVRIYAPPILWALLLLVDSCANLVVYFRTTIASRLDVFSILRGPAATHRALHALRLGSAPGFGGIGSASELFCAPKMVFRAICVVAGRQHRQRSRSIRQFAVHDQPAVSYGTVLPRRRRIFYDSRSRAPLARLRGGGPDRRIYSLAVRKA